MRVKDLGICLRTNVHKADFQKFKLPGEIEKILNSSLQYLHSQNSYVAFLLIFLYGIKALLNPLPTRYDFTNWNEFYTAKEEFVSDLIRDFVKLSFVARKAVI